jgi:hypothetical protein
MNFLKVNLFLMVFIGSIPCDYICGVDDDAEGKSKSYFQRFREGTSGVLGRSKTKVADKFFACGTNCANGKQSIQALVTCAYTHPRVPLCMKGMKQELGDMLKNIRSGDPDLESDDNILRKSFFQLSPLSQKMSYQIAETRLTKSFEQRKKSLLPILARYYKSKFKQHFFVPGSKEYKDIMEYVEKHKAEYAYIGYIIHKDSLDVQQKGGVRMAHGIIIYSPERSKNRTGEVFEVPLNRLMKIPELETSQLNKYITFNSVKNTLISSFEMRYKNKLRTLKYKIPVSVKIMGYPSYLLSEAPSVDRTSKPRHLLGEGHKGTSSSQEYSERNRVEAIVV